MNNIYKQVGEKLNLPASTIKNIYKWYWAFIKEKIEEIDFSNELSKEEFDNLKTSFNIVGLGKLASTYDKYCKIINKNKHIKYATKHKKDKTNV